MGMLWYQPPGSLLKVGFEPEAPEFPTTYAIRIVVPSGADPEHDNPPPAERTEDTEMWTWPAVLLLKPGADPDSFTLDDAVFHNQLMMTYGGGHTLAWQFSGAPWPAKPVGEKIKGLDVVGRGYWVPFCVPQPGRYTFVMSNHIRLPLKSLAYVSIRGPRGLDDLPWTDPDPATMNVQGNYLWSPFPMTIDANGNVPLGGAGNQFYGHHFEEWTGDHTLIDPHSQDLAIDAFRKARTDS